MGRNVTQRKITTFIAACCLSLNFVWADSIRHVDCCVPLVDKKETRKQLREDDIRQQLIKIAESSLYVRELTGNNDHPMITKWMKLCGLDGDKSYPWCAAAQTGWHDELGLPNPESARVVDWFYSNVTWKREWGDNLLRVRPGCIGALYYTRLGRYGHIFLIVGEDNNNYYTIEGNTNKVGSREGDGVYKKIRSKSSVAALADYCVSTKRFIEIYDKYLQKALR